MADFLLAESQKNPSILKKKADSVLLGQPGEYAIGCYYGFLEEARKRHSKGLLRKYAIPFSRFAFDSREDDYSSLDSLISFDVFYRCGQSDLYLGKVNEFDFAYFLEEKRQLHFPPFYAWLSGFGAKEKPSKKKAAAYLAILWENEKKHPRFFYVPFGLIEPTYHLLKKLTR